MKSTADNAYMGTLPAHLATANTITKSVRLWTIPAAGDLAPLLTFAEVRAIAPVAGNPPKKGQTKFEIPWAINSVLLSWRSLRRRNQESVWGRSAAKNR